MGQDLRKDKRKEKKKKRLTRDIVQKSRNPKSVVRPGCSSFCGHQRATHDWLKRPRAQAPHWHQDRKSSI